MNFCAGIAFLLGVVKRVPFFLTPLFFIFLFSKNNKINKKR